MARFSPDVVTVGVTFGSPKGFGQKSRLEPRGLEFFPLGGEAGRLLFPATSPAAEE